MEETLLTFDSFSSVVVNLIVSELSTVNNPVPAGVVSKTVTIAAPGFATVKSACALTAVKILSAVVSLLSFGLNPKVSEGASPLYASEVKVTVVPSDFVNFNVAPV